MLSENIYRVCWFNHTFPYVDLIRQRDQTNILCNYLKISICKAELIFSPHVLSHFFLLSMLNFSHGEQHCLIANCSTYAGYDYNQDTLRKAPVFIITAMMTSCQSRSSREKCPTKTLWINKKYVSLVGEHGGHTALKSIWDQENCLIFPSMKYFESHFPLFPFLATLVALHLTPV